ncbi:Leucine-rich repeat (LRR) protein [Flavobacterium sp. HSC-32F16]|uniref:DUF7619 domain-containing protein n=1 Tax=Flavobacterium sp. HSC-32F16 TaxID=2910964 RepID=UPI0020A5A69C|nr:T9SS type A sorting domain-containing protein [Flavobacterium sp. HSC-32F16]MCP2025039.1 Leucine-rich repeat (LRR) protein [Flavobacterium sp. HSC-32F16]
MIKNYFILLALCLFNFINAQTISFANENFKAKLLQADVTNSIAKDINNQNIKIDIDGNGQIEKSEAELVYHLDVSGSGITWLQGISNFTSLRSLNCSNNVLSDLDVTSLKFLINLNCSKNQLTELYLLNLTDLEILDFKENKLRSLSDTSISYFPNLKYLDCSFNSFGRLEINPVNKLEVVLCNDTKLELANFVNLKSVITLNCANNLLKTADFIGLTNLTTLNCSNNQLTTVNIADLPKLDTFNCDNNLLISLYTKNGIKETSLSFSGNPNLSYVCVDAERNTAVKNLIAFYGYLNCYTYTDCSYNDIVTIPDAKFKAKLVSAEVSFNKIAMNANNEYIVVDVNKNREIELSEALLVYKLNVISSGIASLEGILKFTNITELYCGFNQLKSLDVSTLTDLNDFNCDQNAITTLNINGLKKITKLSCGSNKIELLDVTGLKDLTYLNTSVNTMFSLKFTGLTKLQSLLIRGNTFVNNGTLDLNEFENLNNVYCQSTNITQLKIANAAKLEILDCSNNKLTSLTDAGNLANLKTLVCHSNKLKTLDVSNSRNLSTLDCNSNLLESLFIKTGKAISSLNFASNYDLFYVCTDENQVDRVKLMPVRPGFYAKNVNSYCSFTPGGTFYTINGSSKFDLNSDGCDTQDVPVSNIKFGVVNGADKSEFISDNTGNYTLTMGAGSYTISPKLENPAYFNVSPQSVTVVFPTEISPLTKNFCVTANGSHQDLEVVILPLVPAIPGFDAKYKLIYKNKGNQIQSGSVNLEFNDSQLDFAGASSVASSSMENKLVWDFINLKPFQTREIEVVFSVNSPTETPAVNNGDKLNFIAKINSLGTDETPIDNVFEFNQTVVGSFDPNDKTCLEGNVVKSELIGEYVHYQIRFENKGTYSAKNIVVKDMIDLTKFDISTLMPINASHSYITKINGNKVEFIFENINLPFDDASNDGYISFKIKTKSTLVTGNTFTNDANIYFDYNLPILTNKATSKFETILGVENFKFSDYLTLYPNPAFDTLNIDSKDSIEKVSIEIFDVLGQLVIAVPNAETAAKIDVSRLNSGNYILKIKTNKGTSGMKFIKM